MDHERLTSYCLEKLAQYEVRALLLVGSAVTTGELSPRSDIDIEVIVSGIHEPIRMLDTYNDRLIDFHLSKLSTLFDKIAVRSETSIPYKANKLSHCRILFCQPDLAENINTLISKGSEIISRGRSPMTATRRVHLRLEMQELMDDCRDLLDRPDLALAKLVLMRIVNRLASILLEVSNSYEVPPKRLGDSLFVQYRDFRLLLEKIHFRNGDEIRFALNDVETIVTEHLRPPIEPGEVIPWGQANKVSY